MLLIFAIFLVTQLPHMEASCLPGDYEVNGQCCPMCSAGNKVVKICTPDSSTTCMPCVGDTYTEHPNGLTECMRCKLCDPGARLITKDKCTYTKNTVCGCSPDYFCSLPAGRDCEMCSENTVCLPGSMVKRPGTEFSDNICEDCPGGTFSTTNMSPTCHPWTKCEEQGKAELTPGTSTSDVVCAKSSVNVASVVAVILSVLLAGGAGTATVYFLRRRAKRKNGEQPAQETGDEPGDQGLQNLLPDGVNGANPTIAVQETSKNNGKPTV
ncbi:tumor necrosis factor receptor superfamily member 14 isoform X2 [Emydura macquarii macquarii]|uniref:tumor necrosis factor receptor superfamily member 14 isoform X2 n=1 Tax=Emydura macquarii macquarii TaxID=1129001 RepID=UPI00352B378D